MDKQIDSNLLQQYRDNIISYDELAKGHGVSRPTFSKKFKAAGLLTNKQIKHNSIKHDIFSSIDNELSAYLLGFHAADGSINDTKTKKWKLSVSEKDKEFLFVFHQILCPQHCFNRTKSKVNSDGSVSKPMYSIHFASTQIYNDLENYGFGKNKTYKELHLPKTNYMNHFIRGYFDGDGTIGKYKNGKNRFIYKWSLISKTKTILEEIKNVYLLNNISSKLYYDNKRNVYYLKINKKQDMLKLKAFLYTDATYFLKRKEEVFKAIPS